MAENNSSKVSQQMEQGIAQMDHLKAQIESLSLQRESLASVVHDHERSIKVLEEMKAASTEEFLLPLGGQVYVKARIADRENCVVDQGVGVLMDRTVTQAIEQVKERKERIQGAVANIDRTVQELMARYQDITSKTQELYDQQMRSGPGPEKTF
ncbi:MAG: prefoldin subunit alpha [Thermoplasmatota archaeon]